MDIFIEIGGKLFKVTYDEMDLLKQEMTCVPEGFAGKFLLKTGALEAHVWSTAESRIAEIAEIRARFKKE